MLLSDYYALNLTITNANCLLIKIATSVTTLAAQRPLY